MESLDTCRVGAKVRWLVKQQPATAIAHAADARVRVIAVTEGIAQP